MLRSFVFILLFLLAPPKSCWDFKNPPPTPVVITAKGTFNDMSANLSNIGLVDYDKGFKSQFPENIPSSVDKSVLIDLGVFTIKGTPLNGNEVGGAIFVCVNRDICDKMYDFWAENTYLYGKYHYQSADGKILIYLNSKVDENKAVKIKAWIEKLIPE